MTAVPMFAKLAVRFGVRRDLYCASEGLANTFAAGRAWFTTGSEREQMQYDVCIVGAGPAGLSAAIKIKQLCKEKGEELSVCVLEKGSEVGAHVLSGNVFETRALDELFPDWRTMDGVPLRVPVVRDRFLLLTRSSSLLLPHPPGIHNKGNYIISLSELCRWLGARAEELGVDIFAGFAASALLTDYDGALRGVRTGDHGVGRDGQRRDSFAPGVDLRARLTLLAEGCRGSLTQEAIRRWSLRAAAEAEEQTYALGVKEMWQVRPEVSRPGHVFHTLGYPLWTEAYGGGFVYHMDENRVALGLVVGLDYEHPQLSPYQEFQRFKRHPFVQRLLEGAVCLQYGARTLNEGGLQSVPALAFPGGALLGCSAGFVNVPKIKGTHTAMASGIMAAHAAVHELVASRERADPAAPILLKSYDDALRRSWVFDELRRVRNVRPAFRYGFAPGLLHAVLALGVLRGNEPWTLKHGRPDHQTLRPIAECSPRLYERPDGVTTFDVASSLFRSGTNHNHDQPPHLRLRDPGVPERSNLPHYGGPEAHYCPAGVYEYVQDQDGRQRLQINAQNCLHCKACDIKDVGQNIRWTVPEGGGGPNYTIM